MNAAKISWQDFADGDGLAHALATEVAAQLRAAISARGKAFIAVSGGTTPALFFAALAATEVDWRKVVITLVDERFVERGSPRSNAALVNDSLLRDNAAAAVFVDLFADAPDVGAAASALDASFARLPWPLDVAIFGMGTDGHTASFFPDAPNLPQLLDPASTATVLPVNAPSVPEPRLTLSLARLCAARFPVLHIEGAEKRDLLRAAMADQLPLPVLSLLNHCRAPVRIFWAP
ncbi:MAG: 6-phosphogluconolactonase [Rhizobiaceae bacterium]